MSDNGTISTDPLFVGLTRPTMFLGVSFTFAILNGFVNILAYINAPSLKVIFIAVAVHMFGYVICFKEPLFLELYLKRGATCTRCRNRHYYGANSYDLY